MCVAGLIDCPLVQVEADVIVPIEIVSTREEYSAATIRTKIHKRLNEYLNPLRLSKIKRESLRFRIESFDIDNIESALNRLQINRAVSRLNWIKGGTSAAVVLLREFLDNKLNRYANDRNDPSLEATSNLSPYLHFGQVSPLYITLEAMKLRGAGRDTFLEELIVRRELGINFVSYNRDYDRFEGLPEWCRKTLKKHQSDNREYLYTLEQLENGETHDPYWNAAQKEMVCTGKMAGYMRMYWGKKIIEWTEKPEDAYRFALHLNNKYELDGRDPGGYAGVAWCFGKHDRPWAERSIFGKIRYMNAESLKRKFDPDQYVRLVKEKCHEAGTEKEG